MAISVLKDSFPGYLPCIQIIPVTEAEVKSIINSLKQKNHVMMKWPVKSEKHVHFSLVTH